MNKDDYLIEYQDIQHKTIQNLLNVLDITPGKKLDELMVKDLTYHDGQQIWPGQGVYLFRHGKQVIYVGKVSSMSFTERIPKHFDFRSYAWMNTLLKHTSKKIMKHKEQDHAHLKIASKYAFDHFNVVLINFKSRDRINRSERLLRSCTNALNKFKNVTEKNLQKIVDEY